MDKQVARYVHRQNPDTIEIWDGEVLPVIAKISFSNIIEEYNW